MIRKTRNHIITRALARIPRSGSLHDDVHDEAAVLIKKLRPLLLDYRLVAVIRALFVLAAEYSKQLLRAEREGCDCTHDVANGLFRCDSSRQHAVTTLVEEKTFAKRHPN
jgi:hypothetical protein